MSSLNTIKQIGDALKKVTRDTFHYFAHKKPDRYIVWMEEGEADASWSDNEQGEQGISGSVDYFTRREYDPDIDSIQAALKAAGVSYRLNSVQYEQDTRYIHYEWVWELWL